MTDTPISSRLLRDAIRGQLLTDRALGLHEWPVSTASALPPPAQTPPHPAATPAEIEAKRTQLSVLDQQYVSGCTRCALSQTRTKTVFGQGNPDARLVFVGEAPGFEEDRQGLAFVGPAGQLLTRMIEKGMGLSRDDVFICNVLKCRPPNNRNPAGDEVAACSPYLLEQLSVIAPEVIVALGAPAAQTLLNTHESIGRLRGRFHDFFLIEGPAAGTPIPLMPTYHPAYLLRSPGEKAKSWEDLKLVMQQLGLPRPR